MTTVVHLARYCNGGLLPLITGENLYRDTIGLGRFLNNMVNELRVRCPNVGCVETVNLERLEEHVKPGFA